MSRKPPTNPAALYTKAELPGTPKHVRDRRITAKLVRKLSQDSLKSPMGPDHVTLEFKDKSGEEATKRVYVTEVNGTRTLDLYSGWDPDNGEHKLPLKTLPPKVCSILNLQRLWVSHNHLSSLPPEMDKLVHLKELFLHRNNFEEFPAPVCSLPSLEILWLSCNKIMSIPKEISQLKTLKRLHLDGNYINELTPTLCKVTSLEVLYLNENTLHILSEDIGNLSNLKRLYLQHNKISDLPSGICRLPSIKMLVLDDNEIRHLSREFQLFQYACESKKTTVSLKGNPFMTPQSKLKLSLTGVNHSHLSLKARRHSDQFEPELMARRPLRVSLPGTRSADSLPGDLTAQFQSRPIYNTEYKADTLPRSSTVSVMQRKQRTYHEHY